MKFFVKFSSMMVLTLAAVAGFGLFWVSQQVQEAERDARALNSVITQEQEAIRVLTAEWDYLNRPDRLEELARTYLNMEPIKADSTLTSVQSIPMSEDIVTEPQFVSTADTKQDPTPEPQIIAEPAPPILQQNEKATESDFDTILDSETAEIR
jgi:cell division protein FtsL